MPADHAADIDEDRNNDRSARPPWWPEDSVRHPTMWLMLVPAAIAISLGGAFALLPGQLVFLSTWGTVVGLADCAVEQGSVFVARCSEIGIPAGQVSFEAMFPRTLTHWVALLPGIGSYTAYQLVGLVFMALGAAACIGLVHDLTGRHWPGAVAAVVYLSSPVVLLEPGLPPVWMGAFLLPAALWAMLRLGRVTFRPRNLLAAAAGSAGVALAVLNTSGYSFLHLLTLTTILGGSRALFDGRGDRLRTSGTLAVVLVAAGVTGLLHRELYWPDVSVSNGAPLEFFRGASTDLVAMVVPTADNHLWGLAGARWGDLSVGAAGFVGWVALGLGVVGVVALTRHRRGAALGLAAAVVITGVLALGPSLRINDPWPPPGEQTSGFNSRLMPAEEANFDFPWARAFTLPPLDLARVVRRWAIPLHLALDLAAAVGLAHVARRPWRRGLAPALAGVLAVGLVTESADPSLPQRLSAYDGRLAWTEAFTDQVLEPLDNTLPDDAVTLFLPAANDYLAAAVGPLADLRLLNVSGDKNVVNVREQRNPAINDALRLYTQSDEAWEEAMRNLFDTGSLDALVLGDFSLRWASYRWPPRQQSVEELRARHGPAAARFEELGCDVERFERGWVVDC